MPNALLKPCAETGCPELVASGRCLTHRRAAELRRGSSTERGYDIAWQRLTRRFRAALISADVTPVCGARLPGAPSTADSQCLREGRLMDDAQHRRMYRTALHVDHIVPHRGHDRLRLDLLNLQLLCKDDHDAKTRRERG